MGKQQYAQTQFDASLHIAFLAENIYVRLNITLIKHAKYSIWD
jgi:hypothetical protein